MKAVLLAGGLGTRISEESDVRPKPMIEIGGKPILWHIMKHYATHGITEFVICLGYKGYMIKEFFVNYYLHRSDVTVDLRDGAVTVHKNQTEPWKVTLVETGEDAMTGGRIKAVRHYVNDGTFLCTYGDGVSNIDVAKSIRFHQEQGKLATMTVVQPPGRFGAVAIEGALIRRFMEKPRGDGNWINGGFFVLEPAVIDLIADEGTVFEQEPLEHLAREGQLTAYEHSGFWHPLDTLRDKRYLEELWATHQAPWATWRNEARREGEGA